MNPNNPNEATWTFREYDVQKVNELNALAHDIVREVKRMLNGFEVEPLFNALKKYDETYKRLGKHSQRMDRMGQIERMEAIKDLFGVEAEGPMGQMGKGGKSGKSGKGGKGGAYAGN